MENDCKQILRPDLTITHTNVLFMKLNKGVVRRAYVLCPVLISYSFAYMLVEDSQFQLFHVLSPNLLEELPTSE